MMLYAWLRTALARWRWRRAQDALKARLVDRDDCAWSLAEGPGRPRLRYIGALDISFFSDGGNPADDRACVALVVCELDDKMDDMALVWQGFAFVRMTEPYIAGFLAFREAPHYCAILRRLAEERPEVFPDVVLVDGNGVLHPRGFGVASHVGVLADLCTIGVAKNLHVVDGLDRHEVRERCASCPGDTVPLVGASGRTLGAAVLPQPRKQAGPKKGVAPPKNPIFVSVGHRLSLDTCVSVVKLCFLSARVPEPIRLADVLSREQVRLARAEEERLGPGTLAPLTQARPPLWACTALAAAAAGLAGLALVHRRSRRLGLVP